MVFANIVNVDKTTYIIQDARYPLIFYSKAKLQLQIDMEFEFIDGGRNRVKHFETWT